MSGVAKAVKKVFKKVVKTVKKVLPIALGVGALVFTAGAAMGVLPSWGAAVEGLTAKLGMSTTLTNVLSGAVTQAGYGAALGGATAALTGGDMGKGMTIGAAAGAVTGGVSGGLGFETDPLRGLGQQDPASAASNVGPLGSDRGTTTMTGTPGEIQVGPLANPPAGSSQMTMPEPGSWLERNQTLVGHAVGGLGTGLLALAGNDDGDGYKRGYEARQSLIDRNYAGAGTGLLTQGDTTVVTAAPERPTPADRWDPRTYGGSWQYDTELAKIVWVPNQQRA